MTLGRREYSEAEMLRMQRDAEERVREMQNRARQTIELDSPPIPQRNRNWSSGAGTRRPNRRSGPGPAPEPQYQPPPAPEPEPEPSQPKAPEAPEQKNPTTIIEDIMGALKLDEDYLLIIGLLLILINQRADTTLILALAYLLI